MEKPSESAATSAGRSPLPLHSLPDGRDSDAYVSPVGGMGQETQRHLHVPGGTGETAMSPVGGMRQ